MSLNLSNEQKMVRETANKIALQELAPRAADVDRERIFPRYGLQKLAEAGFLGITVPEAMGGGGSDTLSFVLVAEAIAKACPSTALVFVTHAVVSRALAIAGSDEQKKRLLQAITAGKKLAAFAATEPASGSNPFAITTKAGSDGDDFVVNGAKHFITGAEEAEVYLAILRTDQAKSPADLSALIIEKGTPGFSFGKKEDGMGLRGSSDGELIFQDCRVHRTNLLGAENGYLAVMPKFAGLAMVGTAGISLGIAQAAVDAAIEHAKTREISVNIREFNI
jgi:alkylation response protein AidB-like acyl-CoA dehydrogenase